MGNHGSHGHTWVTERADLASSRYHRVARHVPAGAGEDQRSAGHRGAGPVALASVDFTRLDWAGCGLRLGRLAGRHAPAGWGVTLRGLVVRVYDEGVSLGAEVPHA